jgi:acetyltransferase-like isoleucine patch superfamily enzyme
MKNELLIRAIQHCVAGFIFDGPPLSRFKSWIYARFFEIGANFSIAHGSILVSPHTTEHAWLKIGNNVSIEPGCDIDYSGGLRIEDNVWISERAFIATHGHKIKTQELKKKQEVAFTPLTIGADAWLGAHAIILDSVARIGKGAIVGAAAVVTRDVEDWAIVVGNPARVVKYRQPIEQHF